MASSLPVAFGVVEWENTQLTFVGQMAYEFPSGSQAHLDLILYPNRYLASSKQGDREVVEAYSSGFPSEDRDFLRQHGALVVSSAREVYFKGETCVKALSQVNEKGESGIDSDREPDPFRSAAGSISDRLVAKPAELLMRQSAPTWSRPAKVAYNASETLLRLTVAGTAGNVKEVPKSASGCHAVVLEFRFSPPFLYGNFGVHHPEEMHFSGPFFPVAKETLYDTQVMFRKTPPLACAGCQNTSSGGLVAFKGLPPPTHFVSPKPAIALTDVSGFRLALLGFGNEYFQEEIFSLAHKALIETPLLGKWRHLGAQAPVVAIAADMLIKNIVQWQPGEIQLGRGFLKVTPLFRKYHEAAFLRAFFQETTFQILSREMPPANIKDQRRLLTLARFMAEIRLKDWFSSLTEIRDWSQSLRFLPFFRDIIEGKALVNNEVFLGREESPTAFDTAPASLMFPTFSGAEMASRIEWCLGKEILVTLQAHARSVYAGVLPARTLLEFFLAQKSERCGEAWQRFLEMRSTSESVSVDPMIASDQKGHSLQVSRSSADLKTPRLFQLGEEDRVFDVLEIRTLDSQTGKSTADLWSSGDTLKVVTIDPIGNDLTTTVEGPTTDTNSDRHIYPRRFEFLVTGIKVTYGTQQNSLDLSQGTQWRIRGDDFSRKFDLQLRKEANRYFVSGLFGGNFNRSLGELTANEDDSPEHTFYVPRDFPFTLGIVTEFGRQPEMWIVGSIGASALSSSLLAPSGTATQLSVRQSVMRPRGKERALSLEASYALSLPMARLVTIVSKVRVGQSTEPLKLGGAFAVPGHEPDALVAHEYGAFRSEVRWAAAHDLSVSVAGSVLFDSVIVYAAHNSAVDLRSASPKALNVDSIQSMEAGVRFYGAVFGAKNQSVSFDLARGLDSRPRNVFSLTIGRN